MSSLSGEAVSLCTDGKTELRRNGTGASELGLGPSEGLRARGLLSSPGASHIDRWPEGCSSWGRTAVLGIFLSIPELGQQLGGAPRRPCPASHSSLLCVGLRGGAAGAAAGAPLTGLLASRHSRHAPVGVASPGPARAQVRVPDSCRRICGPAVSRKAAPWEGFAAPQPQHRRPLRAWPHGIYGIYDSRQRPGARLVLTLRQLAPLCRCQEPPGRFLLAFEKDLPVAWEQGSAQGGAVPSLGALGGML